MDNTFPETERMTPNFMVDLRTFEDVEDPIETFGFTLFEAVRAEDMPTE